MVRGCTWGWVSVHEYVCGCVLAGSCVCGWPWIVLCVCVCLTLHALIFEQHALLQPKALHRLLTCEIDLTRNSSTLQNLLWHASYTHLASTAYSNIHSNESCVQHIHITSTVWYEHSLFHDSLHSSIHIQCNGSKYEVDIAMLFLTFVGLAGNRPAQWGSKPFT